MWEFAAPVTSLDAEILTLGQLYGDRAGSENDFDELKNQCLSREGDQRGGFTTRDLKRCRLMARFVALVFNWSALFARLADPGHHREASTTRPLLLSAIGRQTSHAGQTTIRVTATHGKHGLARRALTRISAFLEALRSTTEQLTPWSGGIASSARRWSNISKAGNSTRHRGFRRPDTSTRMDRHRAGPCRQAVALAV